MEYSIWLLKFYLKFSILKYFRGFYCAILKIVFIKTFQTMQMLHESLLVGNMLSTG